MLKEISRTTWIIAIGIFVVLTITIGTITKTVQSVTHKEEIAVEVNSEQLDTGIRLDKESKSSNTFTSYKTIPFTKIEAIDVPIKEWATEQEDAFYKEMKKNEEMLGKDFVAHFDLQSDITKVTDDLFSIKMELNQAVEQQDEYTTVQTFLIDLEQEALITMDSVFNQELFTVQERMQLMDDHLEESLDEDVLEEIVANVSEQQVAIHDDEMIFYFNDKEVRTDNSFLQVDIPMIAIAPYLNEKYESLLVSEETKNEIAEKKQKEEEARKKEAENKKYIALTFDDGPQDETTNRILETLDEFDAKATFFMLGKNAEQFPELAKRVADEGHEVANHSITHANLNAMNVNRIEEEMTHSQDQIEEATGERPILFRPPYGNYNDTVLDLAEQTDQSVVLWSLDTYDWQHLNANATYEIVKNNVYPGSIILMHDIHPTTADALPQILQYLSEEGYEFVTASELLPYIDGEGIGPHYGG